ncbi:hypothetical protein OIU79_001828, partial [Salix purpurea]
MCGGAGFRSDWSVRRKEVVGGWKEKKGGLRCRGVGSNEWRGELTGKEHLSEKRAHEKGGCRRRGAGHRPGEKESGRGRAATPRRRESDGFKWRLVSR